MDTTNEDAAVQTVALRCPHCGSDALAPDETEPHVYRCAACWTRARMTPHGVLLPLGLRCEACGHDNERGNRFCTACGAALTKQCPNCGTTMLLADEFCTACGKSRGQLVAEWYRTGKGALDAGRPWDAVAPLQRLAAVDPDYGDVPNLLTRALREATQTPPPTALPPLTPPSPTARALRAMLQRASEDPRVRRRFVFSAAAIGLGVGLLCIVVGMLMGSITFGVLLFVFLVALLAVNLWATFNRM